MVFEPSWTILKLVHTWDEETNLMGQGITMRPDGYLILFWGASNFCLRSCGTHHQPTSETTDVLLGIIHPAVMKNQIARNKP